MRFLVSVCVEDREKIQKDQKKKRGGWLHSMARHLAIFQLKVAHAHLARSSSMPGVRRHLLYRQGRIHRKTSTPEWSRLGPPLSWHTLRKVKIIEVIRE
mmetsp:Transcript_8494/g.15606  ORF Transcript_8494/g.15606 Transcript_8494/m.15606 type:complete len:99 (+) Transcript_8494:278-574(+)